MSRPWRVALVLSVVLLFAMTTSLAWSAAQKSNEPNIPVFSAKDRQLIEAYYKKLLGNLAPGSIDRSGYPLEVENALVIGSHVPMQLEKDLKPLPPKLESQLTEAIAGDYERYRLGPHVLLVRKGDLAIGDIIKNVAVK